MKKKLLTSALAFLAVFSVAASDASAFWLLQLVNRMNPPKIGVWRGDAEQPKVALTFDDGPDPRFTAQVLDVLRDHDARGTFFLVGRQVERHPDLARRIVAEGHAVGNHSFTHRDLRRLKAREVVSEITRTSDAIETATGVRPDLFRAPFGMADPSVLRHARATGHTTVQWTLSPKDWSQPKPGLIAGRVLKRATNGSIILLHDGSPTGAKNRQSTVDALSRLIEGLKRQGFELVTVPELLASPAPALGAQS